MMISPKEESVSFSIEIENIAKDKHLSYMDAILFYCEQSGFEIEVAAKLVSNALKSKIKIEAEELNYLPKSNTAKLPI